MINDAGNNEAHRSYGMFDTAPETVFDKIVEEASLLTGSPISTITMVNDDRQWFKARVGVEREGDPISESICAIAMRADDAFVVQDASEDDRFREMRAVTQDGIRFYAGIPLVVRDGSRLGTLCVIDTTAREGLAPDEREALEALARRTVAAMEMRRDLRLDGAEVPSSEAWHRRAQELLEQSAAALAQLNATAALAELESVIEAVRNLNPTEVRESR